MKFGTKLSLKSQLILIILLVTTFSTISAFLFSIIFEYSDSRHNLKNNMLFTAKLISENCKSSLLFSDTSGAFELLSSFIAIPTVLQASLYDAEGNGFATFSRATRFSDSVITTKSEIAYFDRHGFHISEPIFQDKQFFGRLVMHVSTNAITKKLLIVTALFLFSFIIIMLVSYYMARKLQLIISAPILELKDYAEQITIESDYSKRIQQTHSNEIGLLQKSFDLMVRQLDKNINSLKKEIRERIVLQQEAIQLKLYLKNIIDSLSSVIIAVDADGKIKQMNLEAQKLLKLKADEAIHKPVTEILTILKDKEEFFNRCISEGKPQKFNIVLNQATIAQQIYLNVSIYPLSQKENQGIVIHIDDITDKTRMESMMVQNEKMMSLGGLAAGMAHEINNPLGIISQGTLNILRHISPDFPKNKEVAATLGINLDSLKEYMEQRKILHYLDGILAATKRAGEIIANMLHFSRMSNQSKTPADIRDVVDQTIELAYNEYELKKKFDFRLIKIKKEYDEVLPELICNVTEIQQVILNLLKNAAYALYTKKDNESQIVIRIRNEGSHVRIDVEDNGPGISIDNQKRIFEPFFTTKEVGVGTGLGLSVSYFIITKNHSGCIEFESTEGVGTRFIIRIPYDGQTSVSLT